MSSILKALKKLEDDNAARRTDELKIDAEILRSDNPPRFSAAGVIVASLLLLAGGSGATYMIMKQDREAAPVRSNQLVEPGQQQPTASAAPEIKAEQLPSVVAVPATRRKDADSNIPAQRQAALSSRKLPVAATPVSAPKAARPVMTPTSADISHNSKAPPSTPSVKGIPALRVNGIAFQPNNADSMAIINGIAVSRGATVEGALVEEVRNDRVLFQHNGEKFEIQLGQSNR